MVDIRKFFDKEILSDAMITLLRTPGVDSKAVRLWWELNWSTHIKIATGADLTDMEEMGEVVGLVSVYV